MQPTYLPWAGYFNLIQQVDHFVFLDDVQYEKRSWQSRNRILLNGEPHWVSVPVKHVSRDQKICDVLIDDSQPWRAKQQRMIQQTYAKLPYIRDLAPLLGLVGNESVQKLADLNIGLIRVICENLGIKTNFHLSSELNLPGKRSEKLMAICDHLGCDQYLSPRGSAEYLAEDKFEENSKVSLSFQNYLPAKYNQLNPSEFVSHLSILDVLASIGSEAAAEYVKGAT